MATEAQQALNREDYNAAIPLLQKIAAARPSEPMTHFELGYSYSELKRNNEAAAEYRRALELNPSLAAAHVNLGLVLLDSDPAAALESFKHAEALLPGQGQPHYLAAQALERSGKALDALTEYQSAVDLAPKDGAMRFAFGRALLNAGRDADAETQFRAGAALPGDASQSLLGLAEVLGREKKQAEAADEFAAYLEKKPADRGARFERAVTLGDLNRFDDAIAELDRLAKDGTPTGDELKLRGSIYLEQKKWTEAAATLQKAKEASANDPEVLGDLGRAQIELHNYSEATATLRQAVAIDPTQVAALRSLAEADYLSGAYGAMLTTLALVEKREPLRPMDWFFRAICNEKLGQKTQALDAYKRFLSEDHKGNPDQEWQAQQRVNALSKELR